MIFGLTFGRRVNKAKAVSTTAVTLNAATNKFGLVLESASICNTNAAARTVSLYVDNGTSQTYIFNDLAIASKATILLTNHPIAMSRGESLKAIASGAGININAVFIETTPNQASEPSMTTLSPSVANKPFRA